jgi:DNA-binding GntR family transcriptional regulator
MPAAGRQTRRRTGTHLQGLALPLAFCSQADMTESSAPVMDKPGSGDSSAEIAEHMAAAIVARQLPPGTRLREEALCRLYGVSRTKIRAALLILSKDKLIRMVPDKGAFVSQPTEAEARDIFAARRIIEAALARTFVARAVPADYRMLERHLKAERQALAQPRRCARSCWATSTCCWPTSPATPSCAISCAN